MRLWHVLKGNARSETAHNLIFFDTETKPEVLEDGSERDWLWFGWLCARSRTGKGNWGPARWVRFTTINQFWKAVTKLTRPGSRWFVFCHNTSYDLPVIDIFNAAARHGWTLAGAVIEAPPTIITLEREGAKLVFLDSLNWLRMPLDKVGKQLGLHKLKMPAKTACRGRWDAYCRRDVRVVMVWALRWLGFLKDHDLGGFAPTLASQCFRTFRHRFMTHEIVIDGDEASHKLSREAYHGGRVECFKLGPQKGPVKFYDVNSMYPAVMLDGKFPIKLLAVYDTQARGRWKRLVQKYAIVARCVVSATAPCYPAIIDKKLKFPLGRIETTLCTPEIVLAMKRGELLDMRDIAIYEKAPIFHDYVEFMWSSRVEADERGDDVDGWLFKHMGTNLYGKFGQTGMVYETSENIEDLSAKKFDIVDYDTGKVHKCRQLGGLLQIMSQEGEARDSFPAVAAHVTSAARVLLWEYIETAGLKNMLYSDTDSLYVNAAGARRLNPHVDPAKLGKLKTKPPFAWMHIHGLKDYQLPDENVIKGVRKSAEKIGPNTYRQTQWSSLKGLLDRGDLTAPRRKQVTKVLKRALTQKKKPDS
jgi:hypothetical protein